MKDRHQIMAHRRGGFSLIEVLFAIFILAIGMLYLGTLVPLVIGMQRAASDTVMSLPAGDDCRAYLVSGRPDLNRVWEDDAVPGVRMGWGALYLNTGWSSNSRWDTGGWYGPGDGSLTIGGPSAKNVVVQQVDRLWPLGSNSPRFVWDFAARRLPDSNAGALTLEPTEIEVLAIIRRIDQKIRVPAGMTLRDAILNNVVSAVAVDSVGQATLTGLGSANTPTYSPIVYVDATYNPTDDVNRPREYIRILPGPAQLGRQRRQLLEVGQMFADNLGNVYTIREVTNASGDPISSSNEIARVRVSPPVPANVTQTGTGVLTQTITQVAYTPQKPVSMFTFRVQVGQPIESATGSGVVGLP